jgi:hypothetical protein
MDDYPRLCFNIIYDIPEYEIEAYKLFKLEYLDSNMLSNMLYNSPLGLKIIDEYSKELLEDIIDIKYLNCIFEYAFETDNKELLYKLSRYSNLHTRFLFMEYLIKNYPDLIDIIYPDITEYTTSIIYEPGFQLAFFPDLMDPEDISKLAVLLLNNNRINDYKKLKEFILNEYKTNYLAKELLQRNRIITDINEEMFRMDADTLFKTSKDYKYAIYLRHKELLSKQLLDEYLKVIKYYLKENDNRLEDIFYYGLGGLLEEWTEKYMDLSSTKEYGFIGEGTTCSCFRIGDYVIKLVKTKWSYEETICPNLYLIAKNYEEKYIRNYRGIVDCGLEVQKYLSRRADNIDSEYFRYFDLELGRLGYRRTDTLTKGSRGENTMLLDSYRDADTRNPEILPDWFKEYPLVLVDRDRIYRKEKIFIKELSNCY